MTKVPEVTPYFWITKVLTTAMGEATSDYLVHRFTPVTAVGLGAIAFAIAMVLQFSVRRYIPWVYWLAAAMVAIFGTMAADVLHIRFGISYLDSAAFLAVVLALSFAVWYTVEKTLSVHSIDTPRREVFYWIAVVTTFALGTAVGDLTAQTMHLGFLTSGLLFTALIAVPALAYWLLKANAILTFWAAYIVTRPLGASFADWMGKAHNARGLGWGSAQVGAGLSVLIVLMVGYQTVYRKEDDGTERTSTSPR